MARILFISHSATRNGASLLLLALLKWLRANTRFECEILVNGTGELVPEFEALGRTKVWHSPAALFNQSHVNRWGPTLDVTLLAMRLAGARYDLAYVNTSAVARIVDGLARHARSMVWHVHELDYVLRLTMPDPIKSFAAADRMIVVSDAVRQCLVNRFAVPAGKIDLVHGFVSLPQVDMGKRHSMRKRLLSQLGWPENAFVVGGCGALGWRKGTDLFLQLAMAMSGRGRDELIRFLWVGGGSGDDESLRFDHDARSCGLGHYCSRLAHTPAVSEAYSAMDVFALTSREDPFPLVMLEASAHGLPVVCFENSGGGPEFVSQGAGLTAPYLDLTVFARHLDTLRACSDLRRRMGASASKLVSATYVVEKQGPKIATCIEQCLAAGKDRAQRSTHTRGVPSC
jgi:glycosyltransferase involved in cell wall biosynthesis